MDSLCHIWKIMDNKNRSYQKQSLTESIIYYQAEEGVWKQKRLGKKGKVTEELKHKTKGKEANHLMGVKKKYR